MLYLLNTTWLLFPTQGICPVTQHLYKLFWWYWLPDLLCAPKSYLCLLQLSLPTSLVNITLPFSYYIRYSPDYHSEILCTIFLTDNNILLIIPIGLRSYRDLNHLTMWVVGELRPILYDILICLEFLANIFFCSSVFYCSLLWNWGLSGADTKMLSWLLICSFK